MTADSILAQAIARGLSTDDRIVPLLAQAAVMGAELEDSSESETRLFFQLQTEIENAQTVEALENLFYRSKAWEIHFAHLTNMASRRWNALESRTA